jgi:methylthioribose-1-phosphate isomerase
MLSIIIDCTVCDESMVKTIYWSDNTVFMLDQSKLPFEIVYIPCEDYRTVADGIKKLWIRGAPAIGIAAAMGIALAARDIRVESRKEFMKQLEPAFDTMLKARPTAVNIRWAVDKIKNFLDSQQDTPVSRLKELLREESQRILDEDIQVNRAIGEWGAQFIKEGDTILTHCNAGSLATGGYGTATAPMLVARE